MVTFLEGPILWICRRIESLFWQGLVRSDHVVWRVFVVPLLHLEGGTQRRQLGEFEWYPVFRQD